MSFNHLCYYSLLLQLLLLPVGPTIANGPHLINIRYPNLYPESLDWDPSAQHFVVGSMGHGTVHSVSDAGVLETIVSDPNLPPKVSVLGIAVDSLRQRLLAVIHAVPPLPTFNALAAYDLSRPPPHPRIFLAPLTDPSSPDLPTVANDVSVDPAGNAYVTNSAGYFIWKIDTEGRDSIFSNSSVFRAHPVPDDFFAPWCGINGIAYTRKGSFLVVQTNTGKVFKIDADDGTARLVLLSKDLLGADGIAMRADGTAVVVSYNRAWFLKSDDAWAEAVVFDEIPLDASKFPTAVTVREGKPYVVYGHVDDLMKGNAEREEFSIEEIESEREKQGEKVWLLVLIGFGLAYFLYWRFQMGKLVKNMNKKMS